MSSDFDCKECALLIFSSSVQLFMLSPHIALLAEHIPTDTYTHIYWLNIWTPLLLGGAAHIAGIQLATIPNKADGTFCLEALRRKVRLEDDHEPITSLIIVENTHNICGGKVIPLEWLDKLAALVNGDKQLQPYGKRVALHMDGARVFNAAAALQVPVARIARDFDSVNFCLSKGLSAPVGSVLVGSEAFIRQ